MTADSTKISKGERDELRRVVRGNFKALGAEVKVRRAELIAEIERRVADRFKGHETTIREAEEQIDIIVAEANGRIHEVLQRVVDECEGYTVRAGRLDRPRIYFEREKRDEMRRAMVADLDARCASAEATMLRQENDLLRELSVDALESDAAHAFLKGIPTVAELVPASRLAELEASFDTDVDG